jgi:molybdate transport system substrate-binding protein
MITTTSRRLAVALSLCLMAWTVPATAADLVVSAAASLTNAFQKVAKAYEAKYPDTKVVLNFAASDVLLQQIANGAPADVFASADQKAMDKAQVQNAIVESSRKNFATNQLVLIEPSSSSLTVKSLDDLKLPVIKRIAYGDPASVPVGRYTQGALQAAGVWADVTPKGVLAQSVRQALDYVARDEVDVGFVYATDAAIMPDKVKIALRVTPTTPISYPIAVIKASKNPSAAQTFETFVLSTEGQQILATSGFLKP